MYLVWPRVLTPAVARWSSGLMWGIDDVGHTLTCSASESQTLDTKRLFKHYLKVSSFLLLFYLIVVFLHTHLKTSLKHYLSSLCQTSLKHCLSSLCQTSLKHYLSSLCQTSLKHCLSSLCQTSLLISAESLNRNRIFCYLQTCVGSVAWRTDGALQSSDFLFLFF